MNKNTQRRQFLKELAQTSSNLNCYEPDKLSALLTKYSWSRKVKESVRQVCQQFHLARGFYEDSVVLEFENTIVAGMFCASGEQDKYFSATQEITPVLVGFHGGNKKCFPLPDQCPGAGIKHLFFEQDVALNEGVFCYPNQGASCKLPQEAFDSRDDQAHSWIILCEYGDDSPKIGACLLSFSRKAGVISINLVSPASETRFSLLGFNESDGGIAELKKIILAEFEAYRAAALAYGE